MLFNSLHFVFFFPVVIILYFLTPYRWRWLLLLVSSYYFYMSLRVVYALLVVVSTSLDYFARIRASSIDAQRKGRAVLASSWNGSSK